MLGPALALSVFTASAVVLGGDLFIAEDHPSLLSADDEWVVNLEGGRCAAPGSHQEGERWRLCSVDGRRLRALGVDVVGLANNHAADGAKWTAADLAGLERFGGRVLGRAGSSRPVRLVGWHDTEPLAAALPRVAAARERVRELVVVYAHRTTASDTRWARALRQLAAAGADVVVGHGGHEPGPIERVGRSVVFSDLGDLAMDCACSDDQVGMVVRIDDDHERTRLRVQPIQVAKREGEVVGRPLGPKAAERLLSELGRGVDGLIVDGELVLAAGGDASFIVQKPITWNAERDQLTRAYRREHYGEQDPTSAIEPTLIVVHHTAIDSDEKSFKAFDRVRLVSREKLKAASPLNVSSHFLVERDGRVLQLMPETTMARHVIGLNWTAIGIENVGGAKKKLTRKQLDANVRLIRHLKDKHPGLSMMIGHHEYQRFRRSKLWKERDALYITGKVDPGDRFMARLRKRVADLELSAWPPDVSPKTDFSKGSPRELTLEELQGKSLLQLVLLRNELFARHGYPFHKPYLLDHFNKQAWYQENPRYKDDLLTETDKVNLKRILEVENAIDTDDLRVLRNTVFARRGRPFKSPDLQAHFQKQPWYKPDPGYTDRRLTRMDKLEIKIIQEREKRAAAVGALSDWKPGRRVDADMLYELAREEGGLHGVRKFLVDVALAVRVAGFYARGCQESEETCQAFKGAKRSRQSLPVVDRETLELAERALAIAFAHHNERIDRFYDHMNCDCVDGSDEGMGDDEVNEVDEAKMDACWDRCERKAAKLAKGSPARLKKAEARILKGRHASGVNLLSMDIREMVAA